MSKIKHIWTAFFVLVILCTSSFFVFSWETEDLCNSENTSLSAYDNGMYSYKCNVQNYCQNPWEKMVWMINYSDLQTNSLTKWAFLKEKFRFPEAGAFQYYSDGKEIGKYITDFSSSDFDLSDFDMETIPKNWLQTKKYYENLQNNAFNCAVLNMKIYAYNHINEIDNKNTDAKKKRDDIIKNLGEIMDKNNCVVTSAVSIHKALLDEITYNYCEYRFYLEYLQASAEEISSYIVSYFSDTEEDIPIYVFTNLYKSTFEDIIFEKNRVDEIFPQIFAMYEEFMKTYETHLFLEMIEGDYIQIREKLRSLLNPITQTTYKTVNAQK